MKTKKDRDEDKAYYLGEISGIRQVEARYRKEAGEAFSLGQSKTADILLEVANEIKVMAASARQKFDNKYHPATP